MTDWNETNEYEITITDAVRPGLEPVTLRLGNRRALHFRRATKKADALLTHRATITRRSARQLVRDGYDVKPDPMPAPKAKPTTDKKKAADS